MNKTLEPPSDTSTSESSQSANGAGAPQSVLATVHLETGPLPRPAVLREYEDIQSGFANRIIEMAEKEQEHRHELDIQEMTLYRDALNVEMDLAKRGQSYGFWAGLLCLAAGTALTLLGHTGAGTFINGTVIVSLVSIFVVGSRKRRGERKNENP